MATPNGSTPGAPTRNEPDVGEIDYGNLFGVIDELSKPCGWQGWVGCEYRPRLGLQAGATSTGLQWLRQLRRASR